MKENTLEEIKSLVLSSQEIILGKERLKKLMADTLRNQINNLKIEKKKWQIK
tara:strand:- start:145 stop:300 length:156 start_codon:yes stop_codon:yes gene_type:complete